MEQTQKRGYTPQDKETRRCLEAIEGMVKTKAYRKHGYQLLEKMDVDEMSIPNRLHLYYVKARYHDNQFIDTSNAEHLESVNDLMDHLFAVAYQENQPVRDIRYFFTRANTKFELASMLQMGSRREWLLSKSKAITDKALEYHPDNRSFRWLKEQLAA